MNYIVVYKKSDSDIGFSFFYTLGLRQVVDFYNNFGKDLSCLYVKLYNFQDNSVTLIERNETFVGSNLSVNHIKALFREEYNLDRLYYLP